MSTATAGSGVEGLLWTALGGILLAGRFSPEWSFARLWPVLLIAIGLGMLWDSRTE